MYWNPVSASGGEVQKAANWSLGSNGTGTRAPSDSAGNLVAGLDLDFGGAGATADANATLGSEVLAKSVTFDNYSGTFSFGTGALNLTGNAFFSSSMGINQNSGRLVFSGASGTQEFTPKSGDTLPTIWKLGAGQVEILNTLKADSLHIAAGTFDLASQKAHVLQFTSSGGTLEGFPETADTLFIYERADFSGLQTFTPEQGAVMIKAMGNQKTVLFNPGGKTFHHLTLYTVPVGGNASVQVGPGALITSGNLLFRSQRAPAGQDALADFKTLNPDVTVGGNISQILEGSGANLVPVQMGDGAWKVTGNAVFSLGGGSGGNSNLQLVRASGSQTLNVTGGTLGTVRHAAAGTVVLGSALNAAHLSLTAGVFDLNGFNTTLTGDLEVNGAPGLLTKLGGRTLTVGGNATLLGRTGNNIALNPSSDWFIKVAGTFVADFVTVANSNASGGNTAMAGAGGTDQGRNFNWSFNGGTPIQIPSVTSEPRDSSVLAGSPVSFTMAASGSAILTYAWRRSGDPTVLGTAPTLAIANATLAMNGWYYQCIVTNSVGKDTTREAKLTVRTEPVPAKVTVEPLDKVAETGGGATFSVGTEGDAPLTFAWYRKGEPVSIGSAKDLALSGLTLDQNGTFYFCIVENALGKDTTREALLQVVVTPIPAKVTSEPKDSAVFVTGAASFTAAAEGSDPKAFKWQKKGDTTTLGTDPTLAFASTKLTDDGLYICIVSNAYGKDTTRETRLTVKPAPVAPTIVRDPADTLVKVGGKAVFSAGVLGTAPLVFEWRKAGDTAVVSKDSAFTIASATEAMSGNSYYVVVHNSTGIKDTSAQARLTVRNCDSLAIQVSVGPTANEGSAVKIWGKAVCADRFEWSVVSGPAPRIQDPGTDTLALKIPRVAGDTAIRYLFSAWFGEAVKTQSVEVKIKEAIPDPVMGIAASQLSWTGARPLVVRPQVFNKAQLDLFTAYPLRYLWSVDPILSDSAQTGDSLSLRNPYGDGRMDVVLCVDNGGKAACDTVRVDVDLTPTALARRGTLFDGALIVSDGLLSWLRPGVVRVWSWDGRLLFEARGREGSAALLPQSALRALRARSARLVFTP